MTFEVQAVLRSELESFFVYVFMAAYLSHAWAGVLDPQVLEP